MQKIRTIAALIITYNEEDNIGQCLETVKWCDEIILLDSYSDDKTVEIADQYTEKIYLRKFDDFASQRNYALGKVTSDWVLVVDADERVTEELKGEIDEILTAQDVLHAYKIPRKNYFLGKWIKYSGWYPDYTLRLFKNKGVSYSGKVHEGIKIGVEEGKLRNPLLHYTYKDLDDYLEKINLYTTIAAEEMYNRGKKKGLPYILLRPVLEFIKKYFLNKGFLLGKQGLFLAIISAYYQFVKYIKLWEKNNIKDIER